MLTSPHWTETLAQPMMTARTLQRRVATDTSQPSQALLGEFYANRKLIQFGYCHGGPDCTADPRDFLAPAEPKNTIGVGPIYACCISGGTFYAKAFGGEKIKEQGKGLLYLN